MYNYNKLDYPYNESFTSMIHRRTESIIGKSKGFLLRGKYQHYSESIPKYTASLFNLQAPLPQGHLLRSIYVTAPLAKHMRDVFAEDWKFQDQMYYVGKELWVAKVVDSLRKGALPFEDYIFEADKAFFCSDFAKQAVERLLGTPQLLLLLEDAVQQPKYDRYLVVTFNARIAYFLLVAPDTDRSDKVVSLILKLMQAVKARTLRFVEGFVSAALDNKFAQEANHGM